MTRTWRTLHSGTRGSLPSACATLSQGACCTPAALAGRWRRDDPAAYTQKVREIAEANSVA